MPSDTSARTSSGSGKRRTSPSCDDRYHPRSWGPAAAYRSSTTPKSDHSTQRRRLSGTQSLVTNPVSRVGGPSAAVRRSMRSPAGASSATPPTPPASATTLGVAGSGTAVVDVVGAPGSAVVSVVRSLGRRLAASPSSPSSWEPPPQPLTTSATATTITESVLPRPWPLRPIDPPPLPQRSGADPSAAEPGSPRGAGLQLRSREVRYLTVTVAPAPSRAARAFSDASLFTFSSTALGALSTSSLASLRPR